MCPFLSILSHLSVSTSDALLDTVVLVTCDVGYEFEDGRTVYALTCTEKGEWDADMLQCHGKYNTKLKRTVVIDSKHQ